MAHEELIERMIALSEAFKSDAASVSMSEILDISERGLQSVYKDLDQCLIGALNRLVSSIIDNREAREKSNVSAFLRIRGLTRRRLYDATGKLPILYDAVDDLRAAVRSAGDGDDVDELDASLAVALVRLGEQTGDIAHLREALKLLEALEPFDAEHWSRANAKAVARLRIGSNAGDGSMVERAARELQAFYKAHQLHGVASDNTNINIAAILLENARQNRSARVYRSIIEAMKKPFEGKDGQNIGLQIRSTARMELSSILNETELLQEATFDLETLVERFQSTPKRQLEALHSLAQCHFRIGKADEARRETAFENAVKAIERALRLTAPETAATDSRRHRLEADLGAYLFALGTLRQDKRTINEARKHYRKACDQISIERAPSLFAQVAKGLFELEYQMEEWRAPADVADLINRAYDSLERDRELTSGVHDVGPRQRAGIADKYAYCLIRLCDAAAASCVLDNARGRRISIATQYRRNTAVYLSDSDSTRLVEHLQRVRDSLEGGTDWDFRLAWEDYVTLRRSLGFELSVQRRDSSDILRAVPRGGAYVQLTFSSYGSNALIWFEGAERPDCIELPASAYQTIAEIFHGTSHADGWTTEYESFLTGYLDQHETGALNAWNETIQKALSKLGEHVFDTLHNALEARGLKHGAPVRICPPGDLSLLPLPSAKLSNGSGFFEYWSASVVPNSLCATDVRIDTAATASCLFDPANPKGTSLPLARSEAVSVMNHWGNAVELCGDQLTPAASLRAFRESGIVHIACHGQYDATEPGASGLYLADGEKLSLMRLTAASVDPSPTKLAFLSACEGAISGRTVDYDEFFGLPGALLQLGVSCVIAAHWAVFDDAARVFADHFYRDLKQNAENGSANPAQSLAKTCIWMRDVRMSELEADGYLTALQADRLSCERAAGAARLRRFGEAKPSMEVEPHARTVSDNFKPFTSPCHWAAWSIVGA